MRESIYRWIAWHIPNQIAYWVYVRVGVHATCGKYGDTVVPEISMMDALKRWQDDKIVSVKQ